VRTPQREVAAYFLLTFAISWAGVFLAVGGLAGIPGTRADFERLLPFAVAAMLAGPSVAGLLMTRLAGGRAGLRELRSRLCRWRVGSPWYGFALLVAPLTLVATLYGLSAISPDFLPGVVTSSDPTALVLMGLGYGLCAGLFEELGWTGFAVPRLRSRHGLLATGLMVGIPWGAWHLLSTMWGSSGSVGAVPLALYLAVTLFSFLPPFRVLMVWVHDRTGSLPVTMLMHASLTASTIILAPQAISGAPLVVYHLAWCGMLWVAVAIVVSGSRRALRRRPPGDEARAATAGSHAPTHAAR
jgi:membrane protease YdiL (CAAX protease family)